MNETLSEKTFEKEKVKRILDYLCWYTESLMSSIHGDIRGIPQGPAYARVLAELFLSTILTEFCKIYHYTDTNCRIIRYVDDIYVIYYGLDGKTFLQRFHDYIEKRGLQINKGKSAVYERIGNMKSWEKEAIFVEQYLDYYGEQLIRQKIGRGSIYSRLYHEI